MYANELLNNIRKYQFYALELNLFLDNFPDNEQANEDYKIVSCKLRALMNEYEKDYGPLTNFGSASVENAKAWLKGPWPWESDKKED